MRRRRRRYTAAYDTGPSRLLLLAIVLCLDLLVGGTAMVLVNERHRQPRLEELRGAYEQLDDQLDQLGQITGRGEVPDQATVRLTLDMASGVPIEELLEAAP